MIDLGFSMKLWHWVLLGMCDHGEEGICGFELAQVLAGGMGLPGQRGGSGVWG